MHLQRTQRIQRRLHMQPWHHQPFHPPYISSQGSSDVDEAAAVEDVTGTEQEPAHNLRTKW